MKAILPILTLLIIGAQGIHDLPTFAQTPTLEERVQTLKNSTQRWIEVNVATQRLTAWEGSIPIYSVIISTGKAYLDILTALEGR
ncbi:L,D-transpeptidase [Roseofilum sp. BLCC_M91]|uniref:L,D-transpeptidase n=1 Tax=Roseofilum halophilum BLCC-M91 TaxID=3022259 RepID=A0ABT7BIW4_9CYAN|nr:L,D-transpeptidase [Roseofilum halophilum]MDJ1179101.1 L,D-transpeptidase [Roseofilum halophilum BLCC-M91]